MKNENIPNAIKQRLDIKAITLDSLNTVVQLLKSGELEGISVSKNTSVVLLTTIGLVEGKFVDMNEPEEQTIDTEFFIRQTFKGRNNRITELEEHEPNLQITNNSSAIVLKDVVISPYANLQSKLNLKSLIFFADQILGISFGEFQNM